jgi:hypothetical protein
MCQGADRRQMKHLACLLPMPPGHLFLALSATPTSCTSFTTGSVAQEVVVLFAFYVMKLLTYRGPLRSQYNMTYDSRVLLVDSD